MRSTSTHLDIYDDPRGIVLAKYAQTQPLSEKVASSVLLDAEGLDRIPDRLFALQVEMPNGTFRNKFAMHDEAHVVTSMIYFLDNCEQLPLPTMAKVAGSLVNACGWYDLDPPEAVVKIAMLGAGQMAMGALGLGAMKSEATAKGTENKSNFDRLRAAQVSGVKQASHGQTFEDPLDLIFKGLKLKSDPQLLADYEREAFENETPIDHSDPGSYKKADLGGTSVMPHGVTSKPIRKNPHKNSFASKVSGIHFDDLIDTTPAEEAKVAEFYAHPHTNRYPLDTESQVKQASAYFDEHYHDMSLQERRVFAQSVELRSQELDCKVAGAHLMYAGDDYGPHIQAESIARVNSFAGTEHEGLYREFRYKLASYNPLMAVEVLTEIDKCSGADRAYGRPGVGFRDPYQAVFGKTAASDEDSQYTWRGDTDYVSGMDIAAFAEKKICLDKMLGEGFSADFQKDPVGMFKSLPDPHKSIIARLSKDSNGLYQQL